MGRGDGWFTITLDWCPPEIDPRITTCRFAIHAHRGSNKGHDTVTILLISSIHGSSWVVTLRRKVVEFAVSHETHNVTIKMFKCDSYGADPPRFSPKPTCHVFGSNLVANCAEYYGSAGSSGY